MATFLANVVRVPLMEDPGTRYRYSEATTVLGRLVEIWSGKPFDEFLAGRVFKPLRMIDTGFVVRPDQLARWTTALRAGAGRRTGARPRPKTVPFTTRPALIEGAVGLVSTVPDYLRFAQMLLNKGELDGVRAAAGGDGRADDRQRSAGRDPQAARRHDGLGARERQRRAGSRVVRRAASTDGTVPPARSSGSIQRARW